MLLLRLFLAPPPTTDEVASTLVTGMAAVAADELTLMVTVWFDSCVDTVATGGFGGTTNAVKLVDCALHITCTGAPSATISYGTYNHSKDSGELLCSKLNCYTKVLKFFLQSFKC